jgi:type I restriction enzyme M protein
VVAPDKFRWERLPRRLIESIAGSLGLPIGTAAAELAGRYGISPDLEFIRENWDVLRDEWLPEADDARRALVGQLWELGVGYAVDYPTGRHAEMAFLRTCNNARRLREAVLAELIPLGEGSDGQATTKPPAEETAGNSNARRVGKSTERTAPVTPGQGKPKRQSARGTEPLGFEDILWKAADKLRGSMDASEYKHVVLGLIFLKYVEDAFEERRAALREELAADGITGAEAEELLESRDEYTAEGVFWVPPEARWHYLRERAKQPGIGKLIDGAMDLIELDNPSLRGVLPKTYARPSLDVRRLGELVDLISGIGLGAAEHREKDILGRVYEYFLGRFASSEGKGGGEFYTPRSVVRLLVEMIEPYSGRVYDPCCGSGGMFVQAERFVEAHGGRRNDIAVYGQELNDTTWRLAKMNLAIRGIEADLGPRWGDSFHEDLHPDLKADYILANPPFNISDWGGEQLRDDARWRYGVPPASNANYAWLQHIVSHLSPRGVAGVVLANGSLSSPHSGEDEIRRRLIDADLVECIVALPAQLFYSTQIPASLWFLDRDKTRGGARAWRDRRGETLFIDIRKLGVLVDRTHREFTDDDLARVARTYHAWRGEPEASEYVDVPGFCASVTSEVIATHQYALTPGRYVGAEDIEEDDEPLDKKIARLTQRLYNAFDESNRQQERVRAALGRIHE